MKGEHSTGLHQHTGEREDLLLQTVPVGHTFNAEVEKTLLMLITSDGLHNNFSYPRHKSSQACSAAKAINKGRRRIIKVSIETSLLSLDNIYDIYNIYYIYNIYNIYTADAGDHAAGVLPLLGLLAGLQGDGVVGAGPRHRLQRGLLQVSCY